jgi:hypothetical protein
MPASPTTAPVELSGQRPGRTVHSVSLELSSELQPRTIVKYAAPGSLQFLKLIIVTPIAAHVPYSGMPTQRLRGRPMTEVAEVLNETKSAELHICSRRVQSLPTKLRRRQDRTFTLSARHQNEYFTCKNTHVL